MNPRVPVKAGDPPPPYLFKLHSDIYTVPPTNHIAGTDACNTQYTIPVTVFLKMNPRVRNIQKT